MAFNAGAIESTLTLDLDPFHRGVREARREAERLGRERPTMSLGLDTDAFSRALRLAQLDIQGASEREYQMRLGLNRDEFRRRMAETDEELDRLDRREVSPNVSSRGFAGATRGAGLLMTAIIALGPAIVPITAAVVGGALAMGSAFVTAGAAVGIFALATKSTLVPILDSYKKLAKAREAYDKATTKKAKDTALDQQKMALDGLNKTQLRAVLSIDRLKAAFAGFGKSAQGPILDIFIRGINSLINLMKQFEPVVKPVALALHGVVVQFEAFTKSQGVTNFANFLTVAGPRAVLAFVHSLRDVFVGLSNIFAAFRGPGEGFLSGMERASEAFRNWTASPGLTNFVQVFRRDGPLVGQALTAIGGALWSVTTALGPMGGLVLRVLIPLANGLAFIADKAPWLIQGLWALFLVMKAIRIATMLWAAAQVVLNVALSANPVGLIVIAIAALVAGVIWAYKNVDWFRKGVDVAWAGIKVAWAQGWAFIQPIIKLVLWYIKNLLIPYYKMLWQGVQYAWAGIVTTFKWAWPLIRTYFNLVRQYINLVRGNFEWLWKGIKVYWQFIVFAIKVAWVAIRPIWQTIVWYAKNVLGPAFKALFTVARAVFRDMWGVIQTAWGTYIRPAFDALKRGVFAVRDAFRTAVSAIKSIWNGLKEATRAPVAFVVNTVYQNGIRRAWEGVRNLVPALPAMPSLHFAEGGVLPGYTPGRDSIMAMLSPGEGILRPEVVRGLGEDFIHKANYAGKRGGPDAVARLFGGYGDPSGWPGFADGGIVGSIKNILKNPKSIVKDFGSKIMSKGVDVWAAALLDPLVKAMPAGNGNWEKAIFGLPRQMVQGFVGFLKKVVAPNLGGGGNSAAVQAARSQIGLPYAWGGGGLGGPSRGFAQGAPYVGFDCSSLMEYAWGKASGGKDITRTTYSQRQFLRPIAHPVPGAVGQPHVGHTYMYSGNGHVVEAARTGTNIRETTARGGEWWGLPPWKYDMGGDLRPGATLSWNNTGKTESVVTAPWREQISAQLEEIRTLASTGKKDIQVTMIFKHPVDPYTAANQTVNKLVDGLV